MNNHVELAARELVQSRLEGLPSKFKLCKSKEYTWPTKNKKKKRRRKTIRYGGDGLHKLYEFYVYFHPDYCLLRIASLSHRSASSLNTENDTENILIQRFEYNNPSFDSDLFNAILDKESLINDPLDKP